MLSGTANPHTTHCCLEPRGAELNCCRQCRTACQLRLCSLSDAAAGLAPPAQWRAASRLGATLRDGTCPAQSIACCLARGRRAPCRPTRRSTTAWATPPGAGAPSAAFAARHWRALGRCPTGWAWWGTWGRPTTRSGGGRSQAAARREAPSGACEGLVVPVMGWWRAFTMAPCRVKAACRPHDSCRAARRTVLCWERWPAGPREGHAATKRASAGCRHAWGCCGAFAALPAAPTLLTRVQNVLQTALDRPLCCPPPPHPTPPPRAVQHFGPPPGVYPRQHCAHGRPVLRRRLPAALVGRGRGLGLAGWRGGRSCSAASAFARLPCTYLCLGGRQAGGAGWAGAFGA